MKSRVAAALLTALIAVSFSMGSASADPPSSPSDAQPVPATGGEVTVPMVFDCASAPKTKEARALMTANSLCGFGQSGRGGPQGESVSVSGNCGTLTFSFEDDRLSAGRALIGVRVSVPWYFGPVLYGSFSGAWINYSTGYPGQFSGSSWGSSTTWFHGQPETTGPGFVAATLVRVDVNTAILGPCHNASLLSEGATIR